MNKYMSIEIWERCQSPGCLNGATHEVYEVAVPGVHASLYQGKYCPEHTSELVEGPVVPQRFKY